MDVIIGSPQLLLKNAVTKAFKYSSCFIARTRVSPNSTDVSTVLNQVSDILTYC
jgi:hypothetical protein